jgi:antibiotic biosynthesis monooxygenase (ABM) superfamily enzyme
MDDAATAAGVIYEVNLDLDAAIAADYLAWLREHIAQICALPGFLGATLHLVSDPVAEPGRSALCVQYRLRDQSALDDYLREHAPRLRADGMARFGGKFSASRRVLQPIAS